MAHVLERFVDALAAVSRNDALGAEKGLPDDLPEDVVSAIFRSSTRRSRQEVLEESVRDMPPLGHKKKMLNLGSFVISLS